MEVNKDKQHWFQKPYVINKDGNAVISQIENNFTQKQAVKTRVKGSFACTECGKSFIHMKSHNGEKRFTCTQCGKSFTCKNFLKIILSLNAGVRSFSCGQCDKTFAVASSLKEHSTFFGNRLILQLP